MNASTKGRMQVSGEHLHPHLRARMLQRGITQEEIERTLNEGAAALDAKPGTQRRVFVFPYQAEWEGTFFAEKEVTVCYKMVGQSIVILTAKARYGSGFGKRVNTDED